MPEKSLSLTERLYLNDARAAVIDALKRHLRLALRGFGLLDQSLQRDYFDSNASPKLHIGCGSNLLPGWLNCDFFPPRRNVVHMDATRRFPFQTNTFHFIFSEHVIEHIPFPGTISMLRESWRVLKPGGTIRICTPDIDFAIGLFSKPLSREKDAFTKWVIGRDYSGLFDEFDVSDIDSLFPTFHLNRFVRAWGHTFIFDRATLRHALQMSGFENIVEVSVNHSSHDALKGLENDGRLPPGYLELQSITLEATKPEAATRQQNAEQPTQTVSSQPSTVRVCPSLEPLSSHGTSSTRARSQART